MRKSFFYLGAVLFLTPLAGFSATVNNINFGATGWRFQVGNAEASSPTSLWRTNAFNDSGWTSGATPIGYGEADIVTTLPDARLQPTPSYLCAFARHSFTVTNPTNLTSLALSVRVDDGYVAWINGVEVLRDNMPGGDPLFTSAAISAIEPTTTSTTISSGLTSLLVPGVNTLAIQLFNANTNSSDLLLDASLTTTIDDVAPTIVNRIPAPGQTVQSLLAIEVVFSEAVQGVEASDLLINGVPATNLIFGVPGQFAFEFAPPPTGAVFITFTNTHGITDLVTPANPFTAVSWSYVLDPNSNPGTFRITEFMAANGNGIRDEDGDTSDWIEIYNPSQTANLQGWALTDDPLNLSKWKFPYYVLNANNYFYVWASGKTLTNISGNLKMHTSFALNNQANYLALVDPQTNVVSVFNPYPDQSTDISFGRDLANPELVGFYSTPTPGTANLTSGSGVTPEVTLSHSSRTFVSGSPFQLTLSTPGYPNSGIFYALGTNVPGSNTVQYSTPLTISTTTVLRVRAFVPGLLPGPVRTVTYFALSPTTGGGYGNATNAVSFQSTLPIMIIHTMGQGPASVVNADGVDQNVVFQVFDNDCGKASMTNLPNLTGRALFHSRGSSTLVASGSGKASFFFEVRDDLSDDRAVSMMGLPPESDWVLYAPNAFEPGIIHNSLAHAWYRDLGRYGSRTRFFEMYLQDDSTPGGMVRPADYYGLFILEEKIKRDESRVNIERLDAEDSAAPAITGGYLLSIDRTDPGKPTVNAGGATLNWLEPSAWAMTNAARAPQIAYVQNYWNSFNSALNNTTLWTNPLTGFAAYIDVPSWIDLHIHEVITFNVDALRLSGYMYKDRNKKIEYGPSWDYDRTQGSTDGRDANPRTWRSTAGDLGTDFFNFAPWWNRLLQAPDFWQAWIDRYQELREGTNVLSTNNIISHINRLASEMDEAYPREFSRWNRPPRGANGSGAGTIATEIQWKRNWYTNRLDFADNQFVAKPSFSIQPGPLSNTVTVTVTPAAGFGDRTAPNNQLILSLDGTDPRLSGGAVTTGPNILSNTGPIMVTVSNTVRLVARTRNVNHVQLSGANNPPITSPWSGPTSGTFYFPSNTPPLRITEIMYHPSKAPPGNLTNDVDNFEYLEFKNASAAPLDVTGFRLRGGVHFDFPALTLAANQACVVVSDLNGFLSRYDTNALGIIVAGSYTNNPGQNRLGNGGDHLVLQGRYREPILDFNYSDNWYPSTDGAGFALQIVNAGAATGTWGLKESWRSGASVLGSPGAEDAAPAVVPPVVINEILTHTDLPQVDAIEVHNPTALDANIGGWFLTDNYDNPKKYRIPANTSVPANGYLALYSSNSFGATFDLSSRGEEIYLFSGDANTNLTGYMHGFDFGAQANGVTFGRYITSSEGTQYPAQSAPTLGSANSGPKVGPVVISEIMYHPPDVVTIEGPRDNNKDEFIELANLTGGPLALFDTNNPANTWRLRDAVSFTFPTNVYLSGGERILLVSFDPLADPLASLRFRATNGVDTLARLFGPYQGQLDNSRDAIELVRPDVPQPPGAPDAGAVYYVLVDKVNYSDLTPWPTNADGTGFSLQRIVPGAYGNDATNWVADATTAGVSEPGEGAPVFTMHPQSISVLGGNSATFSVTVTGAPPITYQWRFNNADIGGATAPSYTIPFVAPANAGSYRCVARNGGGAVLSSNAVLTYIIPPNITQQPANVFLRVPPDPLAPANRVAIFTVTATSASPPLSYRWRVNGTNVPLDATNIFGMTTNRLVVTNVVFEQAGVYTCAITDGNGSISSAEAVLGITPYLMSGSQPMTIAEGADISVSAVVQSYPPPFLYSWRRSTPINTNILSSSQTNFATWNSTATGYALTNSQISNTFPLRLVFTNLATGPNGGPLINSPLFITVLADTDHDGIPNTVETALGLDPDSAADGGGDLDGDRMTNADEYRAGTDPTNPTSYLRIDQTTVPGTALVYFASVSNRTYTVQYTDALPGPVWFRLGDVFATSTPRTNLFLDPDWTTNRFYRVVTPRAP